jgi:hypothetical protein
MDVTAEIGNTLDIIKDSFEYEEETGKLLWKTNCGECRTGDRAGRLTPKTAGGRIVEHPSFVATEAAVIWSLKTGQYPAPKLFFLNGDPGDTCWENLAPAVTDASDERLDPDSNRRLIHKAINKIDEMLLETPADEEPLVFRKEVYSWPVGVFVAHLIFRGNRLFLGYYPGPRQAEAAVKRTVYLAGQAGTEIKQARAS